MSTVSDRICQERDCLRGASRPVVVETVGALKHGFALCEEHADRIDAGADFSVEREAGEESVLVIDHHRR